jgi:hypothetical protein
MYPNDTQALLGSSISLMCEVQGFPLPQVTWLKDDMPIDTDSFAVSVRNTDASPYSVLSILDLWDVQLVDIGEYQCRATSNLTSIDEGFTSESFNLTILSKLIGTIVQAEFGQGGAH